jgi:hypothetical protein
MAPGWTRARGRRHSSSQTLAYPRKHSTKARRVQEVDSKIKGLERQVGAFELHGYFRSGYGLNSAGGQQLAFEAPGALTKYRLGHEAATYGEFIFVNNLLDPEEHNSDMAWTKTAVMIEANTTAGCAGSRLRRKSARAASLPAGPYYGPS